MTEKLNTESKAENKTVVSDSAFNLDEAKEKMRNYRDLFGGQFDSISLNQAKSIFDLENLFNDHSDFLSDMERDAQSSLSNFKRSIGVF